MITNSTEAWDAVEVVEDLMFDLCFKEDSDCVGSVELVEMIRSSEGYVRLYYGVDLQIVVTIRVDSVTARVSLKEGGISSILYRFDTVTAMYDRFAVEGFLELTARQCGRWA